MLAEQKANDRRSPVQAENVPNGLVWCAVPRRIDRPVHDAERKTLSWGLESRNLMFGLVFDIVCFWVSENISKLLTML